MLSFNLVTKSVLNRYTTSKQKCDFLRKMWFSIYSLYTKMCFFYEKCDIQRFWMFENKKRRTPLDSSLFLLARPRRFERLTHSLEGCCSIQLSYGRSGFTINHFPLRNKFRVYRFSVLMLRQRQLARFVLALLTTHSLTHPRLDSSSVIALSVSRQCQERRQKSRHASI